SSVTLRMDLTLGGLVADVEEGSAERDLVISGDITENTGAGSGARTLTKNGGGTLHLSGVSTYTGATTVSEGCLTVEDYTSIPNVTLVSVAPGAGFGGVVGPSHLLDADIQDFVDNVAWDAGGGSFLVIDTNGADITVAADITGDIGLIKKGDGVLTLSGNNTYTGATIIEGGSIGAGGAITEVMISKSGTDVTLTFTSSGNVDVYRSTDLQNWGDAYASNQSSPYTDTAATGDRMFYVLVPTGQAAP
ncbi:MAG: autotransporter-associated beta strand repeat-containing protein, partial [Verrucomicrobiae bacterium]|nr:autotransporter-associated beta strand repeat-containing protein [Verrucomicrobiae bacterium]